MIVFLGTTDISEAGLFALYVEVKIIFSNVISCGEVNKYMFKDKII